MLEEVCFGEIYDRRVLTVSELARAAFWGMSLSQLHKIHGCLGRWTAGMDPSMDRYMEFQMLVYFIGIEWYSIGKCIRDIFQAGVSKI